MACRILRGCWHHLRYLSHVTGAHVVKSMRLFDAGFANRRVPGSPDAFERSPALGLYRLPLPNT
jgi:hypothetical protein